MTPLQAMLELMREMHVALRGRIIEACETRSVTSLASVADDGPGDTIFAIDKVSEELLVSLLRERASSVGGLVLIAEGIAEGQLVLPEGADPNAVAWRLICDPIDGTRGLMYQKRSAWILSAVAPNRGPRTRLSDVVVAVQTELPLVKQHLCDELWAVRGQGVTSRRFNRLTGETSALTLRPSHAPSIEQGYAMISRFFPGVRDELASIDEELIRTVLGPPPEGKTHCFEEQYASTAGQLYELCAGHDRFNADLRPLMGPLLVERGLSRSLCCHPYDICTALIAEELGVIVTQPDGSALDPPLDVHTDVAWVGYANPQIQRQMAGPLRGILVSRGLL